MALIKHEFLLKPSTKLQAFLELSFAGVLWGFGFIGTVWALKFLSPSAILFYRFSLAFIGGACILLLRKQKAFGLHAEFTAALIPGILLYLTLFLQTWGLQATTATNSAFITSLYVLLVPMIRSIMGVENLNIKHWLCLFWALIGMGLMVELQYFTSLNWGDLLTLLCAVFAALHIIVIGKSAPTTQNEFAFNTFQSFWVALFSLIAFPWSTQWRLDSLDDKAWLGLLSLGLGSSMIAFFLQIRSQKRLSPSIASLLFLLESPASCFFAFWLLQEKLTYWQWLGALQILLACGTISLLKSEPEPFPNSDSA